jgi:hypothetical protein
MSEAEVPALSPRDEPPPNRQGAARRIWRRFGTTAVVEYLVVAIFSVAYGIVRLGWPHVADGRAVIVGILASGPIALAFVWERLTGLKLFGVELTLTNVTVRIDQQLDTALTETQYFSGEQALLNKIVRVIEDPTIELLEINLRNTPYWWSTRLFLQAALIEDHTNIQRLVFVDGGRRYVGMATPRQVRLSLAQPPGMNLELRYSQIVDEARRNPPPGKSEMQPIIDRWSTGTFINDNGREVVERDAKTDVSVEDLRRWVSLDTFSVEWDQPLDSALLQAVVLERGSRFVPLTQRGRLMKIVNGDAFARQCATQTIRVRFA